MADNRIPLPGFVGPSYVAASDRFNNQRTVNMYIETDNVTGSSKSPTKNTLLGTPGLVQVADLQNPFPTRQLYTPAGRDDYMYAFVGNQVWLTTDGENYSLCSGTLNSIIGFISVSDNGIDIVAVDGYSGYKITIGSNVVETIVSANFYPADTIDFLDGYFICNRKGTSQFFTSDLYATTWPALNTATKSSTPDPVIGIITNNKLLYVMGSQSIEIWADTGESFTTPFAQIQGQYISIGCEAAASIVQLNGTVFWLGKTVNGGGIVYQLDGQNAQPVSTRAVELKLQSYGDLSKSTAYGYQEDGHNFYVLNFANTDTTWVYDQTENQWHERQSYDAILENGSGGGVPGNSTGSFFQSGTILLDDYTGGITFEFPTAADDLIAVILATPIDSGKDIGNYMPSSWKKIDVSTDTEKMFFFYRYSPGGNGFPVNVSNSLFNSVQWTAINLTGVGVNGDVDIIISHQSTDDAHPVTFSVPNTDPSAIMLVVDTDRYSTFSNNITQLSAFGNNFAIGIGNGSGDTFTATING